LSTSGVLLFSLATLPILILLRLLLLLALLLPLASLLFGTLLFFPATS
jgi:hypothetical protein